MTLKATENKATENNVSIQKISFCENNRNPSTNRPPLPCSPILLPLYFIFSITQQSSTFGCDISKSMWVVQIAVNREQIKDGR